MSMTYCYCYLDDILCITKASLDDHLDHLRLVFTRLQEKGLKINALESKFCAEETEFLGYILTRTGIKPQPKKVQATLVKYERQNQSKISVAFWAWSVLLRSLGKM